MLKTLKEALKETYKQEICKHKTAETKVVEVSEKGFRPEKYTYTICLNCAKVLEIKGANKNKNFIVKLAGKKKK